MRMIACVTLASLALLGLAVAVRVSGSGASNEAASSEPPSGLTLENLLRAPLEGAEGIEIIVSRVTMPPNSSLPKHWHPGEEFGYVLEGTVVLWQEGKEDIVVQRGEVTKVPLKQVHTAVTRDEGATILVFRVHEAGQPERVPVD